MSVEVLGVLASVAFFARLTPQPVRLWRTGVPDGVSPMAAMNSSLSDLGWILYGTAAGLVPVWLTALVALGPGLWTVWLLRRETTRRDLLWSALWLATIALAWASGTLAAILGVSVVVNQGPQVVRALRHDDLRGVSPTTYVLALADAALWGAYGLAAADVAVVGYAVVLLAAAVTVLGRIWWTRRLPVAGSTVLAGLATEGATP
jgi:uncharacterized protein with PQ loop repeat